MRTAGATFGVDRLAPKIMHHPIPEHMLGKGQRAMSAHISYSKVSKTIGFLQVMQIYQLRQSA